MSDEKQADLAPHQSARVSAVSHSSADAASMAVHAEMHVGPVAAPHTLRAYHDIDPDLMNRVVCMAEKQADHRRSMETMVVRSQVGAARLGMVFGLIVALAGLGVTAYLGQLQHPVAAAIVGCVDIVALVAIFVRGKRDDSEAKAKKAAE